MLDHPLICDTSLLLYLGRSGSDYLLPRLFNRVIVPRQVVLELDMGRMLREDTIDPTTRSWATLVDVSDSDIGRLPENRLGPGEQAVIACALNYPKAIAGLDDYRARQLATSVGLYVVGTLGILLRAKRAGNVQRIQPLLDTIVA